MLITDRDERELTFKPTSEETMTRLIAVVAFALTVATAGEAMPVTPLHQPDGMITQVRLACGPVRTRVNGVAWPERRSAIPAEKSADARDGMEAFVFCGTDFE
jgi:hypothetical protein